MKFQNIEGAYTALALYLQSFVGRRKWDVVGCQMTVYNKMAKGSQWFMAGGVKDESGGFEENSDAIWDGLNAAIFIRDDLLKNTGQRIWGLTFTLYPDGKFNIEYDYNKPEGYEETDDVITGDEINASLNRISRDGDHS